MRTLINISICRQNLISKKFSWHQNPSFLAPRHRFSTKSCSLKTAWNHKSMNKGEKIFKEKPRFIQKFQRTFCGWKSGRQRMNRGVTLASRTSTTRSTSGTRSRMARSAAAMWGLYQPPAPFFKPSSRTAAPNRLEKEVAVAIGGRRNRATLRKKKKKGLPTPTPTAVPQESTVILWF